MSFLSHIAQRREYQGKPKDSERELVGIIDHHYLPIALGDSITVMINMAAKAHDERAKKLRLFIVADGGPFNNQRHITKANYFQHINDLLPVYSTAPLCNSLHVFYDRKNFRAAFYSSNLRGMPMWPAFVDTVKRKADYSTHHYINSFYARHGFIPKLVFPRGYEKPVEDFYEKHLSGKFVVAINIRQRVFMPDQAAIGRDSPMDIWYRFLDIAREKYPNVVFVNIGGVHEWERDLARKPNVVIPRILGLGLGHELGILMRANLFMGTSSGFAAAATFSDVPYVITNYEVIVAPKVGLQIGQNYPFANTNQTISWEIESVELLLKLFEEKYGFLK